MYQEPDLTVTIHVRDLPELVIFDRFHEGDVCDGWSEYLWEVDVNLDGLDETGNTGICGSDYSVVAWHNVPLEGDRKVHGDWPSILKPLEVLWLGKIPEQNGSVSIAPRANTLVLTGKVYGLLPQAGFRVLARDYDGQVFILDLVGSCRVAFLPKGKPHLPENADFMVLHPPEPSED